MSLHQLANHMAAQGRGPDDQLVHMSGKEVAGLQALAQMHGGSLTKNPHTGLTEAGFLDSLMPALVGGAMTFFSDGAISPAMAAGIMGLGTAAHTGDLGKGIMAGMGAYGGAGMAGAATDSGLLSKFGTDVPAAPNVAAPSAGGLAGSATEESLATGGGRDALLSRAVPQDQMASQLAQTTASNSAAPLTAQNLGGWGNIGMAAAPAIMDLMQQNKPAPVTSTGMIHPYTFQANSQVSGNTVGGKPMIGAKYTPGQDTSERQWMNPTYTAGTPYTPVAGKDYAEGGIIGLASGGGPVEQMSNNNAIGANTNFPMADTHTNAFATPYQTPISQNVLSGSSDTNVDPYTGEEKFAAGGGISNLMGYAGGGSLGGYSDGGQMLEGPGDGMSDSIPAQIGHNQPARLAQGEFVVPADVVSHLGNGSTDAGAKQLYAMMNKVRKARTGNPKQGKQINASKFVPA